MNSKMKMLRLLSEKKDLDDKLDTVKKSAKEGNNKTVLQVKH